MFFWKADADRLRDVCVAVHQLLERTRELMATEQELQADLDAIKEGVAAVAAKLAAQAQQIADLQAQILAGTPVTQEQLDGLKSEADAIVTALQAAVS